MSAAPTDTAADLFVEAVDLLKTYHRQARANFAQLQLFMGGAERAMFAELLDRTRVLINKAEGRTS